MKHLIPFSVICVLAILLAACGPAPTAPPKPEPTRVKFQASDGYKLVGYFYPSPLPNAPVIVLMHMWGITQQEWVKLGLVDWLQNWPTIPSSTPVQTSVYPLMPKDIAFNVFTFDYRGHGESGPAIDFSSLNQEKITQLEAGWLLDAEAAYRRAQTLPGVDTTRIVGIGASLGGYGVVASCGETCIGALSLSPGDLPDTPYKETVKILDEADKPVWCIAQEKDQYGSAEACQSASGTNYRSIVYPFTEGGAVYGLHGMALLLPGSTPPDIGQHILDFLLLVAFEKDQ